MMYVKLKEDEGEHYHFCKEHLEEMGLGEVIEDPDRLNDHTFQVPGEICEKCQDLAHEGDCHTPYVKVGSFTETD